MSDAIGKIVEVQPLIVVDYAHNQVYSRIDQIIDLIYSLRDIDEIHSLAPTKAFCNYMFAYARGLRTVYFSAAASQAYSMYVTAVNHDYEDRLLRDDRRIVMGNGRHRGHLVELVRGEDRLDWAAKPL